MTQNQFIQNQVRDILRLTADHNVQMATKSPATQYSIMRYGKPLTDSVDKIIKIAKRIK